MNRWTWLDLAPPLERRVWLLGTAAVLVAGTTGLAVAPLTPLQADAVAVIALGGAAVAGLWLRLRADAAIQAKRGEEQRHSDATANARGVFARGAVPDARGGYDAIGLHDPSFSLPALTLRAMRLHHAAQQRDPRVAAWVRCEVAAFPPVVEVHPLDVRLSSASLTARFEVRGADGSRRRISLQRPAKAASRPPDALASFDAVHDDDWLLVAIDALPPGPLPTPVAAANIDAELRALRGRDPDFDPEAFLKFATDIADAIGAGDRDVLRPRCAYGADVATATPRALSASPARWAAAGRDGWFDTIEVDARGLRLSFVRPTSASDAAWELWRVLGGTA